MGVDYVEEGIVRLGYLGVAGAHMHLPLIQEEVILRGKLAGVIKEYSILMMNIVPNLTRRN